LLQFVAQDYLVFQMTQQAVWLGIVDAAGALTLIATALVGGALADRLPKRATLLVTQSLFALLPAAVGLDVALGAARPWHILVFSIASAAVLALDNPMRLSFLPKLVPADELHAGVALNSVAFTGAS